jgi:hypothetical protein
VTRITTSLAAMVIGAAVVTHGSAQALEPLSPAQLAATSCASQSAHVRPSEQGLVISGLAGSCAGLDVDVALADARTARVVTVSGRLHPLRSSRDLLLPAPISITQLSVRRVSIAFTGVPANA